MLVWLSMTILASLLCCHAYGGTGDSPACISKDLPILLGRKGYVQSPSWQVAVGGIYYPETEQYVPAALEVHLSDVDTPSFSAVEDSQTPIIIFLLKDAHTNKVLHQVQQPHHDLVVMEHYEDRAHETFTYNLSTHVVFLDLPEGWENQDLWVDVISHKGNVIYSTSLTEAER